MATEIDDFFSNLNSFSRFERIKKVYELTDKFNAVLLHAFINEYKEYAERVKDDLSRITGLQSFKDDNSPDIKIECDENGNFSVSIDGEVQGKEIYESLYQIWGQMQLDYDLDIIEKKSTKSEAQQIVDLSDTSAVQKIIYLNELGIIELLRKELCFSQSVNNLTNVITAITGEKHTTMQPYLNALINQTSAENKNPYNSTNTVDKVKKQLINLGINTK